MEHLKSGGRLEALQPGVLVVGSACVCLGALGFPSGSSISECFILTQW